MGYKTFEFNEQLKIGKAGENLAQKFFLQKFGKNCVTDVSDDPTEQKKDIDFYVYSQKLDRRLGIESKYDTTAWGNIFLETCVRTCKLINSRKETLHVSQGWLYGSDADYIAYAFEQYRVLLLFPLKDVADWFGEYNKKKMLPMKYAKNRTDKKSIVYYGEGYAVPIMDIFSDPEIGQKCCAYAYNEEQFCKISAEELRSIIARNSWYRKSA